MARAADPAAARAAAAQVVRTLRDAGATAYFAGGCVRDELLGLHPTDYDVATDAQPKAIRALFHRTHLVGAAFGVVLVQLKNASIEVATFRTEGPYTDKRRPDSVRFATAAEDAQRRDFTINALFLDPLAPSDPAWEASGLPHVEGRVIDLVGGAADLRGRLIRAVGTADARLSEDHLRALRAVRFAARLDFALDPATADAIHRHARELSGVSRERIGEELRRMLAHPSRARAAALIERLGLDEPALAEAPRGADRPLARLAGVPADALVPLALAAWALDRAVHASPPPAPEVLDAGAAETIALRWRQSLCLSNADRDGLREVLRIHHLLLTAWDPMPVAHRKRLAGRQWFRATLTLASVSHPDLIARVRSELASCGVDLSRPPPDPFVTGDDLIALGFRAGPAFKGLLSTIYDAQLEGSIGDKQAGLELARTLWGRR